MESASPAMMQEALRRKKAGAFDITIIIGDKAIKVPLDAEALSGEQAPVDGDLVPEAEAEEEAQELGMAPKGTPVEADEPNESGMMDKALENDPMMGPGSIARRIKDKKKFPPA